MKATSFWFLFVVGVLVGCAEGSPSTPVGPPVVKANDAYPGALCAVEGQPTTRVCAPQDAKPCEGGGYPRGTLTCRTGVWTCEVNPNMGCTPRPVVSDAGEVSDSGVVDASTPQSDVVSMDMPSSEDVVETPDVGDASSSDATADAPDVPPFPEVVVGLGSGVFSQGVVRNSSYRGAEFDVAPFGVSLRARVRAMRVYPYTDLGEGWGLSSDVTRHSSRCRAVNAGDFAPLTAEITPEADGGIVLRFTNFEVGISHAFTLICIADTTVTRPGGDLIAYGVRDANEIEVYEVNSDGTDGRRLRVELSGPLQTQLSRPSVVTTVIQGGNVTLFPVSVAPMTISLREQGLWNGVYAVRPQPRYEPSLVRGATIVWDRPTNCVDRVALLQGDRVYGSTAVPADLVSPPQRATINGIMPVLNMLFASDDVWILAHFRAIGVGGCVDGEVLHFGFARRGSGWDLDGVGGFSGTTTLFEGTTLAPGPAFTITR